MVIFIASLLTSVLQAVPASSAKTGGSSLTFLGKRKDKVVDKNRTPFADREVTVGKNIYSGPGVEDGAKVQLKISGHTQLDMGFTSQRQSKEFKKSPSFPYFHIGDSKLKFETSVKAKNDMVVGWLIRFAPQVGSDEIIDRNGFFWKYDPVGSVEGGNLKAVDDSLFKTAQRLIGGANGWDSGLPHMFVQPDQAFQADGVDMIGSPKTATKISFYTPKIGNVFTFGISYTPCTSQVGQVPINGTNPVSEKKAKITNNPLGYAKFEDQRNAGVPYGINNLVMVARFDHEHNGWIFGGALAYVTDRSEMVYKGTRHPVYDTNSFGISALVGYGKVKFGIEYMNNGRSRLPKDNSIYETALDGKSIDNGRLFEIKDAHKGHAGHAVTSTFQVKVCDWITSAYGYQWTYRKLNEKSNTTRHTFSKTVNVTFMPGFEGYVEADLITLVRKDDGKENKKASNKGLAIVAGVRVHI